MTEETEKKLEPAKEDPFAFNTDMVFDLGSLESPSSYLKDAVLRFPKGTVEDITQEILKHLSAKGRERLLQDLLSDKVGKINHKLDKTENMNEKNPDPLAYPYVNGYNKDLYQRQLAQLQIELLKLQYWVKEKGKKVVILFEGRDAAGKGGTIKRFTDYLNPRGARVVALPKPSPEQTGQWYYQRYTAHLPSPGEIVFFDRSWYNRAVVEPVMGFCTQQQTDLFLQEVRFYETSIVRSGTYLIKFWLDVSREEQRRRFKQRRVDPLKRWKLSPVDLASLDKWDEYSRAIQRMFEASDDFVNAPWTIIRSDDKLRARLNAIRYVLRHIDYDNKDVKAIGEIDPLIAFPANSYYDYAKVADSPEMKGNSGDKKHKKK